MPPSAAVPAAPTRADAGPASPPGRFRSAERRNARIGRPLHVLGRVGRLDEDLMAEIGRAFLRRDEEGHALALAMRAARDDTHRGDRDRVTMGQVRAALAGGVDAVPDAPPALRRFIAVVEATPPWVDWERVDRGAAVYRRFGRNAADVLLQLSLIGGYRFGGPPDLLAATGGLRAPTARRRLAETQAWTASIGEPGRLRPGTRSWQLTVGVRVGHALVGAAFEDRRGPAAWDVERWGLPINQADLAATLGLFDAVVLMGVRALGVPVSRADAEAVMHLWRLVGWLLGVEDRWLVETERERHRLNLHLVRAQAGPTAAGAELSQALIGVLAAQPHGRYRAERALAMLTALLGRQSVRALGLPVRPPWPLPLLWVQNTVRYRLLGRTAAGRRRLDAWAERVEADTLRDGFGDAPARPAVLGD